jgi:AcrR family transcriptional regulator
MSAELVPKIGRPKDIEAAEQRKNDILESASHLFAANGYADTKVDTVADDLDISKGTIYRYFSSKRELFIATVDREIHRLQISVTENRGDFDNPLDQIIHATSAYLRFFKDNPHAVDLITQERATFPDQGPRIRTANDNPMLGPIHTSVQGLMDAGYIREFPLERLMGILSNLLYGTIMSDSLRDEDDELTDLSRSILDVVLLGVTTEKARQEWGLNEQ